MATTYPNKFPGKCGLCGGQVAEMQGRRLMVNGAWRTEHTALADCQAAPVVTPPAAKPTLAEGFYMSADGDVFRLVIGKNSGRPYFKYLHVTGHEGHYHGEWIYSGTKPFTFLTAANLLTQEQAKEFGLQHSICIRCTRDLELRESVHVGYGKTCAGHMGWWYPTKKEMAAIIAAEEDARLNIRDLANV